MNFVSFVSVLLFFASVALFIFCSISCSVCISFLFVSANHWLSGE